MSLLVLLLSIAVGIVATLLANRRTRNRGILGKILIGSVFFSTAFFAFWMIIVGAFFVILIEPWPLALRQGPDTDYSRSCFKRHLRETPPESITDIYCRNEWGFGGDSIHSIRFSYAEDSVLSSIIQRLDLQPIPPVDRRTVRYLPGPPWWPDEAYLRGFEEIYRRRKIEFLWIDHQAREVYYQRANF